MIIFAFQTAVPARGASPRFALWAGEACGESVEKSMDHELRESMKPGPIRANPEEELTPQLTNQVTGFALTLIMQ